ncbi:HD-GYP domain-containing protein [Pseudomarimonas arenosa]|uniref:DUF3391 domain-containing protein n=1 Tax=Pseudomarimonas arenosa TaxID=2774145 RepID=A0AAW3ZP15_9GAMM|nr:HD-GYP domain-containing protein [Pseudomarimonas arenosa]MBD8526076.1 DUF3391 domain-containing protein [Pseudomarimonas arenosa]
MADSTLPSIDVDRLRVGMFVVLDVGWQNHPFPFNSFKLRTGEQLNVLRSLNLGKVRYDPDRSDVAPLPPSSGRPEGSPLRAESVADIEPAKDSVAAEPVWRDLLAEQAASLQRCEVRYQDAVDSYRLLSKKLMSEPGLAREAADKVVSGMLDEVRVDHEVSLRVLSDNLGEHGSSHSVNVAVLCVLLAQACDFGDSAMSDVVRAALLHDIGKQRLPSFLQRETPALNDFERKTHRRHVEFSVEAARHLGAPLATVRAIEEHHEAMDGSGYPFGLRGEQISPAGRLLALINRYENLVSPGDKDPGMTPHDALAYMYARERQRFDPRIMALFVKMMGVYPPGSLVELSDQRLAIVVSALPGAALSPRVMIVEDPKSTEHGLAVDLNEQVNLRVVRSLKADELDSDWARLVRRTSRGGYYIDAVHSAAASA